ncbi:hypothetical protein [Paraburkholderia sp. HP33-1]|uniref:hypothetical protein n=1 Tax=Paraburkholderia sp. HP33-1 TaxID=2883243 RepID=UPI001F43DAC8|nr:hypothetical protein [Paraburkholderia sp. HP33-1]
MSRSLFEMHSVELFCQRPLGACYVICDERHYKACLGKAADLQKARAETLEFLGIAELNQRKWKEDLTLVRRLIDRKLLAFHGVRNWNPNTDGWWIINALLNDVRKGARLAIKGPRADLFPPPHCTPVRNLPAREVDLPNGESLLASRYVPITWQTPLIAARAVTDGNDLADDRNTSTLLGHAQPFDYQHDLPNGDAMELAGSEGRPRNNFAQNKQTNDVARILRLTPDQAQQLHHELRNQPPMGFHEIMERAKDMFNLW